MTEKLNGDNVLVSKDGLEVRQALIFQRALIIVDLADK